MSESLSTTGTPEANTYLFISPSGSVEFGRIDEDMAQLNDFCVQFLSATAIKVDGLENESRHGKGIVFQDKDGETWDLSNEEVQEGATMELDVWQDTNEFLARANCLLLLACFTEKSLVSLCQEIGGKVPRARPGQSKVAACLEFLRAGGGLQFEEPEQSSLVRKKCSEVRNSFAHGEWDKCRELVGQLELPNAFAAVTSLLNELERAYTFVRSTQS